jgi:SAM-dependent methyltransferase
MNRKIYNFLYKNLHDAFNLPKYNDFNKTMTQWTIVNALPWTPKRWEKFCDQINNEFDLEINFNGTIADITHDIDQKYSARFWGGIWQPRTEVYQYTGWNIVEIINKANPKAVLDVGCGFNQFKARIPNLVGIDAYNNNADYMVDILDYNVPNNFYDHVIVFGSINFGEYDDIEVRMKKVIDLTMPGGKIYVRANPGHVHKNGQWIDIYPWNFDTAYRIANKFNCELSSFKKDNGDRLYFELRKMP